MQQRKHNTRVQKKGVRRVGYSLQCMAEVFRPQTPEEGIINNVGNN